jgi:hypothetical protein
MITVIVVAMKVRERDLGVLRTGLTFMDMVRAAPHGGMKCQQASGGD